MNFKDLVGDFQDTANNIADGAIALVKKPVVMGLLGLSLSGTFASCAGTQFSTNKSGEMGRTGPNGSVNVLGPHVEDTRASIVYPSNLTEAERANLEDRIDILQNTKSTTYRHAINNADMRFNAIKAQLGFTGASVLSQAAGILGGQAARANLPGLNSQVNKINSKVALLTVGARAGSQLYALKQAWENIKLGLDNQLTSADNAFESGVKYQISAFRNNSSSARMDAQKQRMDEAEYLKQYQQKKTTLSFDEWQAQKQARDAAARNKTYSPKK